MILIIICWGIWDGEIFCSLSAQTLTQPLERSKQIFRNYDVIWGQTPQYCESIDFWKLESSSFRLKCDQFNWKQWKDKFLIEYFCQFGNLNAKRTRYLIARDVPSLYKVLVFMSICLRKSAAQDNPPIFLKNIAVSIRFLSKELANKTVKCNVISLSKILTIYSLLCLTSQLWDYCFR